MIGSIICLSELQTSWSEPGDKPISHVDLARKNDKVVSLQPWENLNM